MIGKILKEGGKELAENIKKWTKITSLKYDKFEEWYSKLTKRSPWLKEEKIEISGENFKKALNQAFKAGREEK